MQKSNRKIEHLTVPIELLEGITDFYLVEKEKEEDISGCLVYPGALSPVAQLEDLILQLLKDCRAQERIDFNLHYSLDNNEKILFRGHTINSLEGRVWCLRKLSNTVPDIQSLGYKPPYTEILISDKLNNGGLVIMCGETGQGKSTTAAAAILYRLKEYGSFCLTIEDPIEMPLQGKYIGKGGNGICYQTTAGEDEIEEAIKGALRSYPSVSNSILFLGEIRTSAMANEVLKIAANGHLVFTTLHALDLNSALERFVQMAAGHKNTNRDEVINLFSIVFRLAIHQKLIPNKTGGKRLDAKLLFSSNGLSQVANKIKTGDLKLLGNYIEQQNMLVGRGESILDKNQF